MNDIQKLITYCLTKPGAYEDFPFGDDVLIFKVRGRIFAQFFEHDGYPKLTFCAEKEASLVYRETYAGIVVRGYHCPPVQQPYFNTLILNGRIPDEKLCEMLDLSYRRALSKLPKYVQKELSDN